MQHLKPVLTSRCRSLATCWLKSHFLLDSEAPLTHSPRIYHLMFTPIVRNGVTLLRTVCVSSGFVCKNAEKKTKTLNLLFNSCQEGIKVVIGRAMK